MADDHDPGVNPEEEGIPDLQDGWPEAERANDPQQEAVPGDEPVAVESFGTTTAEQEQGEPLDRRLAAEEPDVGEPAVPGGEQEPEPGWDAELGTDDEDRYAQDVDDRAEYGGGPPDEDASGEGLPDEETGPLSDDPYPGRPRNQDVFAQESPGEGMSAEEAAVHVPSDQDRAGGS